MKIINGEKRGRNFYMPFGIRPTQNLIRKALFDMIGQDLAGCDVLDIFAGSGSVGLEALSLGAARVTFVEANPKCFSVIEENVQLLGFKKPGEPTLQVELLESDAFVGVKNLGRQGRKFHLVYVDPPYEAGLVKKILKTIEAYDIVRPNYFLVIEHGKHENLPEAAGRFSLLTHRKYGISYLAVYQAAAVLGGE